MIEPQDEFDAEQLIEQILASKACETFPYRRNEVLLTEGLIAQSVSRRPR